MRKCIRCGATMKENFIVNARESLVVRPKGFTMKQVKPNAAVCPNCGEVSLYIDITDMAKLEK